FGDSTTQSIVAVPVVWILFIIIAPTYYLSVCEVVLGLLLLPVMLVTAILLLPFAPEFVLASLFLDVTVEATPPGLWKIFQLSRCSDVNLIASEPDARGLSHSETYADPRSLTFIIDWLVSQTASESTTQS